MRSDLAQEKKESDGWDAFGSSSDEDGDGDAEGGGGEVEEEKKADDAWGVFGSDSDDEDEDGADAAASAETAESPEGQAAEEEELKPVKMAVHTEDALRFAKRSAAEIGAAEARGEEGRTYDAIILDVYTQENFPQPLLTAEFFADLRRCLRKGGGEGKGGEEETPAGFIAVNVGGSGAEGGGFDTVLQRLCGLSLESSAEGGAGGGGRALPLRRVDVLLEDDTEPSQNDEDADPEEDLGVSTQAICRRLCVREDLRECL